MNKKITPHTIKIIVLQCAIIIVAITILGAAINVHNEYKGTGNTQAVQGEAATTESGENTMNTTDPEASTAENTSEPSSTADNTTKATQAQTTAKSTKPSSTSAKTNGGYKYSYAGFNPQTITLTSDTPLSQVLLNGSYVLPDGYKPTLAEAVKGSGSYLDYRVAPFYQAMYDAARKDGITLTPVSGYRSYSLQTRNFENHISEIMNYSGLNRTDATVKAATSIMIPGGSEHNAGLAMDICSLSESFEDTEEFEWLSENAADYGFILRYPKDEKSKAITKVKYEPWHYRFVGVDTAKDIKSKGVTLEEYLGKS